MKQVPSPLARLIETSGTNAGRALQLFSDFLRSLDTDTVVTLATLPPPIKGRRCYVDDATGGGCPCYADGDEWRRVSNDAIVS